MNHNQSNPLITSSEIKALCAKYHLSITNLSLLLGLGQNTIPRYISGESVPNLDLSNRLRQLSSPSEMQRLLDLNVSNISKSVADQLYETILDLHHETLLEEFNGEAFVKKINAHELGYRGGSSTKGAGSFLLIPKAITSFFPPLSNTILNDHTTLSVHISELNKQTDVTYTYHNSKHASSVPKETRDEYRLYLTHLDIFAPGDIAIFIKNTFNNQYIVYKFTPQDWEYTSLESMIDVHRVGKASCALVPYGTLLASRVIISPIFNNAFSDNSSTELLDEPIIDCTLNRVSRAEIRPLNLEDLFTEGLTTTNLETFVSAVKKVKRNEKFRRVVLQAYNHKCCLSGKSISYNSFSNLQAAHIIPKYLNGSDNPTNGLSLSNDLHWAFDNGFFYIDSDYIIHLHPYIADNEVLKSFEGKTIYLPTDQRFYPSIEALKFHHENIYGNFFNK